MTTQHHDVVGIGNAIVDIIGRCDEAFLARHQAPKGHMRLVDTPELMALYSDMGAGIEISGGSAANTIAGVASFGGKTGFIGKVGHDDFGGIFTHDIRAQGVTFAGTPAPTGATSRSLILVTPDGRAKIADFGVAKLAESHMTSTGQLLGTPAFMAPEHFTGARIDGRPVVA